MKTINKPAELGRRGFLKTSVAAPAAASLAVGVGISPQAAWAQAAQHLSAHEMASLVKMARDIYPHDHLADTHYITACAGFDAMAADAGKKAMFAKGVADLDAAAKTRHGAADYLSIAWEGDRVKLLQAIETSAFFGKVCSTLVVSLYNQKELWAKFGYEGSSADKGGYINRGFSDIDWLPQA